MPAVEVVSNAEYRRKRHPIVYAAMETFVNTICSDRLVQGLLKRNWIVPPASLIAVCGKLNEVKNEFNGHPLDRGVMFAAFVDCLEKWRDEHQCFPDGDKPTNYLRYRRGVEAAL